MAENSNNTFQRTMSSLGGGGPSAPQPASSSAGLLTFDIISSAATTSGPSAVQAERQQPVDRFKQLYPNVNEEETPLPRFWSTQDKCNTIGLTQNNLRVHYKGVGKSHNDAASVRTAHPIPSTCGLYYFEVKIISKGRDGYMGIGLTAQNFKVNRLPGWDKQSYGYHGDDGNSFSSSGAGKPYGPTFTTGDIIGCGVNLVDNTCFYTKNGHHLGIAFRDLPTKLYPTVGLQTPGEVVDANFGQEPFKYDIEDMHRELRTATKRTVNEFPIPKDQGDLTTVLQSMVQSYLVHHGYSATAETFAKTTGQGLAEDLTSIKNRQKILKLVMSGRMGSAIEQTVRWYPGLLESNQNLMFMLKCRQFIEMVNGCDFDSPIRTVAGQQTSVIQSTKAYQNGAGGSSSNGGGPGLISDFLVGQQQQQHQVMMDCVGEESTGKSNSNNGSEGEHHVVELNNLLNAYANNGGGPQSQQQQQFLINDVEMENGNGHAVVSNNNSNGNLFKNGTTEGSGNSRGGGSCLVEDDDDVMDVDPALSNNTNPQAGVPFGLHSGNNNNHSMSNLTSNCHGLASSNGNSSSGLIEGLKGLQHQMGSKSGVERMLEFGRDLFQMSQRLEKDQGPNEENQKMLEDAFSLLAYSNPWASPLGWQLCPSRRESVCSALNSAILESMNYPLSSPLAVSISHGYDLLRLMARSSLGACAFVDEVIRYQ